MGLSRYDWVVVYVTRSGMIRVNIGEWIEREPNGLNVRVYSK